MNARNRTMDTPPRPAARAGVKVPDPLAPIAAAWNRFVARRKERHQLARLARHGPRLLRDMGLDPEAVRDALEGSWDEIGPGRFRRLDP